MSIFRLCRGNYMWYGKFLIADAVFGQWEGDGGIYELYGGWM